MIKKTLTVFDIDDTLFTTEAKIRVRKNGEVQDEYLAPEINANINAETGLKFK